MPAARSLSFVAPRHPDGSDWPWLSRVGPFQRHRFLPIYIQNTHPKYEKLTGPWLRWQYVRAMWRIRPPASELAFLFSTDIACGMTEWPAPYVEQPPKVYVGFTQDGLWPQKKIDRLTRALNRCAAVTVFSEEERQLYLPRYRLDPQRVRLIPIHTDETRDYEQYPDEPTDEIQKIGAKNYVLSLGSPNRRFTPIARACQALRIPLVIITRPHHKNDSLDELRTLGAIVITDADKMRSLTFLKHAKFMALGFETDQLPGAYTTLIHGMFMRTPSVVTSCLGIGDYVVNGANGVVTPHGDEVALKTAIKAMWSDAALIERFAANGYERAQRMYSLEAAATKFEALAQDVLKGISAA